MNDVRFAFRQLLNNPGFTAAAVLTFGLAIDRSVAAAEGSPTPSFSIQAQHETAWLVRPNGERFFSFGVCCVNQGASRKEFDSVNPGYAAWQHYADSNVWANATVKRLKAWGFTTVGGWSDFQALKDCRDAEMAFAPVLHIGSTAGAPWWDMWDPKIIDRMDQVAREQILPLRDDPRVIGFYSDNEIGWWNAILFKMTNEPLLWSPGRGTEVWAMFRACIGGDLESVKRLLDKDPSLARCHYAYRTPIYFAVRENQIQVAAFLLEHGADPLSLAVNDNLLDIARDRGCREMENLLETRLATLHRSSSAGELIAAAIRERNPALGLFWCSELGVGRSSSGLLLARLARGARGSDGGAQE